MTSIFLAIIFREGGRRPFLLALFLKLTMEPAQNVNPFQNHRGLGWGSIMLLFATIQR